MKIGGENVLPFYTFDAPIENAPKIGIEITDMGLENEAGVHQRHTMQDATTVAEMAKKAAAMQGVDFRVFSAMEGGDPNGAEQVR